MLHQSSQHLERIANITSLIVAGIFALSIPLGYFLISYSHTDQLLKEQANIIADKVSELIYEQPDFWVYQEHRLMDMIATSNWRQAPRRYVISNLENEKVVEVGKKEPPPTLTINEYLTNGEKNVGIVSVTVSMKPLLEITFIVSIAGILFAWLIHYLLKILPFAALKRSMESLTLTQHRLQEEVSAKHKALQESINLSKSMHRQAMHDALTGLPNRAYFNDHAAKTFDASSNDKKLALLMLDLNRFKEINDSLGHHAGDALLKQVALRLQQVTDKNTFLARLGGDEFALLTVIQDCNQALLLCEEINKRLHQHILLDGYHISISSSIGIACFPDHGDSITEIMRRADIAMYQAKAAGDLCRLYDSSHNEHGPSRLTLTADLRHALDMKELSLVYQPKVSLKTKEVAGIEALICWDHPEHGLISPELFISIAEASGMINDLTRMVLRMGLRQLQIWCDQGINTNMAINISARNLQDDSLIPYIKKMVHKNQIQPSQLTLEITEGNIMIDPDKAQKQIAALSEWGVKISVDDYGTGYSSLAYLSRLAVKELKIDKSFILNVLNNKDDRMIVHSTIKMAHNLGINVTAEGIENKETANILAELGCELGQGNYFYAPAKADDLADYLTAKTVDACR